MRLWEQGPHDGAGTVEIRPLRLGSPRRMKEMREERTGAALCSIVATDPVIRGQSCH